VVAAVVITVAAVTAAAETAGDINYEILFYKIVNSRLFLLFFIGSFTVTFYLNLFT